MRRLTRALAILAVVTPLSAAPLAGQALADTDCAHTLLCVPVNAPLVGTGGPVTVHYHPHHASDLDDLLGGS